MSYKPHVSAICWNNIVLFPVKYIPNAPTITELNEKLRKASNDNRVSFPYPVVPLPSCIVSLSHTAQVLS